jgi:hypothetical protein
VGHRCGLQITGSRSCPNDASTRSNHYLISGTIHGAGSQPITRRLTVSQNFLQRVLVNAVLGTRSPLAQFPVQDATANLNPLLHVAVHPCPPQLASSDSFGVSESLIWKPQVIIWALHFSSGGHSPTGDPVSDRRLYLTSATQNTRTRK